MEKGNKEKGRPTGLSVEGLTWLLFERMHKEPLLSCAPLD